MKTLKSGKSGSPLRGHTVVAAHLGKPPDAVRTTLTELRARGLVYVFGVGEIEAHVASAAAYWRLTDDGRTELARLRSRSPN